jgi:hypothetical protein
MPTKKFSFVWFIIGIGVFYLIYFLFFKSKACPICGSEQLSKPLTQEEIAQINATGVIDGSTTTVRKFDVNMAKVNNKLDNVNADLDARLIIAKAKNAEKKRIKLDKKQEKLNKAN